MLKCYHNYMFSYVLHLIFLLKIEAVRAAQPAETPAVSNASESKLWVFPIAYHEDYTFIKTRSDDTRSTYRTTMEFSCVEIVTSTGSDGKLEITGLQHSQAIPQKLTEKQLTELQKREAKPKIIDAKHEGNLFHAQETGLMDAISLTVDLNIETFVDILRRNQILNTRENIANVAFQYGDEKKAPLHLLQESQRNTFQKLVSNDIKERVGSISGAWQFRARGVEHVELEKGNKYLQVQYKDKNNGIIKPETVKPRRNRPRVKRWWSF